MSNDAPFLRFFVDDYLGDTTHLTTVEHGAYLLTLFACWKRGGSIREAHVKGTTRLTSEQWEESRDTLAEFFIVDEGYWKHHRIVEEIAAVEEKRAAASRAGKNSARRRKAKSESAPKATNAEPETSEKATPVERPLNVRSTEGQRTPNYVDEDVDVESSVATAYGCNNEDNAVVVVSPHDPIDFLRHLTLVHGYDELRTRTSQKNITQARQWAADGVMMAELDDAIEQSRRQIGEGREPPLAYVAKVLAGNRERGAAVSSGPARESRAERVARMTREMHADYGSGGNVPTTDRPALERAS